MGRYRGRVRERRLVFGTVAGEYDEVRAGYPDAVADRVFDYLGGVPDTAVEVGAGTGLATSLFAGRGTRITCVEPDAAMAGVLRSRGLPGVDVVNCSFEEFTGPAGGVGLVYCAQAWHWVAPQVRLGHAHGMLRDGGGLALFGHQYGFADESVADALHEQYARLAPAMLSEGTGPPPLPDRHWLTVELVDSPLFTDVRAVEFVTDVPYPAARYIRLLNTFSPHLMLPPGQRVALHEALAAVLDARGGVVVQRLTTTLAVGRRG